MQQKKNAGKSLGTKARAGVTTKGKQQAGGREFGNVIEPTQAQMASGNKGLAGDFGSAASGSQRKKSAKKSAV